ncbi:MAG: hypothetical protein KDJ90_00575 [Nitratireductor sp.]|nr:hypothetical protein [Nitratireductor sp.]
MALEFYAFKISNAGNFKPEFGIDADEWAQVPYNQRIKMKITYPRSRRRDGFYWATLRDVVEATGDRWASPQHLHDDLLMCLGFHTTYVSLDGEVRLVRDSTAHEAMKDHEFSAYVTKAMAYMTEKLGFDVTARYEAIKAQTRQRRAAA